MKTIAAAFALVLGGCNAMPWAQGSDVSEATCTASCKTHFDQCPQIFAGFPERAAIECPAEHDHCLKICETRHVAASAAILPVPVPAAAVPAALPTPSPAPQAVSSTVRAVSSKEARLRELKYLYDEGLVTDDVYRDRQKAILSEP
jgi:hypothetical protein